MTSKGSKIKMVEVQEFSYLKLRKEEKKRINIENRLKRLENKIKQHQIYCEHENDCCCRLLFLKEGN